MAYHAAWPILVYIEAFLVSNNVAVTYTCKETWDTEEWFSSFEGEADGSCNTSKNSTDERPGPLAPELLLTDATKTKERTCS